MTDRTTLLLVLTMLAAPAPGAAVQLPAPMPGHGLLSSSEARLTLPLPDSGEIARIRFEIVWYSKIDRELQAIVVIDTLSDTLAPAAERTRHLRHLYYSMGRAGHLDVMYGGLETAVSSRLVPGGLELRLTRSTALNMLLAAQPDSVLFGPCVEPLEYYCDSARPADSWLHLRASQ